MPSHVGIFGNDQADRRAGRAIKKQEIEDINIPIQDLKRKIEKNIDKEWQRLWNNIRRYPKIKVKECIGEWKSSNRRNRKEEIVLARARVDTIKVSDLIPKIKKRPPDRCSCNRARIDMYHIVFVCQKYTNERKKITDLLVRDKKNDEYKGDFK